MEMLTVKPRTLFPLERELCIESTSVVRLYLPAGLLSEGERVQDVIALSDDDIEVGFKESIQNKGELSAIIVFLKPGDKITLCRSAEVMVDSDDGHDEIFFKVL